MYVKTTTLKASLTDARETLRRLNDVQHARLDVDSFSFSNLAQTIDAWAGRVSTLEAIIRTVYPGYEDREMTSRDHISLTVNDVVAIPAERWDALVSLPARLGRPVSLAKGRDDVGKPWYPCVGVWDATDTTTWVPLDWIV